MSNNHQNDRQIKMGTLWAALLVVTFGLAGSLLSYYAVNKLNQQSQEIKEPPISSDVLEDVVIKPSEPTDFEKYKGLIEKGQFISVENLPILSPVFSKVDTDKNNEIAKEFLTTEYRKVVLPKQIKNGYLYIKVKAGAGALSDKESIYAYMNSGVHGGHLMKPKSLLSLEGQYLYKLDEIPLTTIPYSDNNTYRTENWLTLLNSQKVNYFGGFVSTVRGGQIDEMKIAFE